MKMPWKLSRWRSGLCKARFSDPYQPAWTREKPSSGSCCEQAPGSAVLPHYSIVFQPSGRRGEVEEGKSLLQAARQLGVDLEGLCGGQQACGKCRVQIGKGELHQSGFSSCMSHLSPPSASELRLLSAEERAAGLRLACEAVIHGPVRRLCSCPEPALPADCPQGRSRGRNRHLSGGQEGEPQSAASHHGRSRRRRRPSLQVPGASEWPR